MSRISLSCHVVVTLCRSKIYSSIQHNIVGHLSVIKKNFGNFPPGSFKASPSSVCYVAFILNEEFGNIQQKVTLVYFRALAQDFFWRD